MNNLYVVAIGGSGERVLHSLIMTLTAGVDMAVDKVVPVIIDNDRTSAALAKCLNAIKAYREPSYPGFGYLCSQLTPKFSFCHIEIAKPIILDVSGGAIGTLKDIIDCPIATGDNDPYATAIKSISTERDLLFTNDELNMALNVGFVGCPNIGSVVLNSKSLSDIKFQQVINAGANDGVIVVGSLFGGTGAAGIPLVINKMLQAGAANTKLGVVAMLPYFQIQDEQTQDNQILGNQYNVLSDEFDVKTRAALMYYSENLNRTVDYIYYVGDTVQATFKKSLGGVKQENPATLCDLMGAMSIVNFSQSQNRAITSYKHPVWGFSDDGNMLSNTSGILNKDLKKAFVKFTLLKQVFSHPDLLPFVVCNQKGHYDFVENIGLTADIISSIISDAAQIPFPQAQGINYLIHEFDRWLMDMEQGNARVVTMGRKLSIFNHKASLEGDYLAKAFFADTDVAGMGLSKYNHKNPLFGREYDEAVNANLLDALQAAYQKLPDQYRNNVANNQILPIALLYISNALDDVIEKCYNL